MSRRLHTAWEAALRMVFRPAPDSSGFDRLTAAITDADNARGDRDRAHVQFAAAIDDLAERLK